MGLLSGKTVIYATHQLEFIDAADLILVTSKVSIFIPVKAHNIR